MTVAVMRVRVGDGAGRGAHLPGEYFDYLTSVEDAFVRGRGKRLLLSPSDRAQTGRARVGFTKEVCAKAPPEMTQGLSDRLESRLFSNGRTRLAHSEAEGEM